MSTFWNVVLIVAASAVAVGGIFGEGYDKGEFASTSWWRVWKYVTLRGWVMLTLTVVVVTASVWKYEHDFADAKTKDERFATERAEWKKTANDRAKETQAKLDDLGHENAGLKTGLERQQQDFAQRMGALKEQNEGLASQSVTLRRKLEDLKKDSESMVLATAMAGSTTSASVLKARDDLQNAIESSADVLHQSVMQYNDALFHLVSDMHDKDVVPMHTALDGRGRSVDDLPTLKNVRDECASPAEIEALFGSPAAKGLCPACICAAPSPIPPVTATPSASVASPKPGPSGSN
jgi:hypothetical protein